MESQSFRVQSNSFRVQKSKFQSSMARFHCIQHVMKLDPPYNTGSASEHYDDNLEHSTWLSLMKLRLELQRNLLSDDGSIWISSDDDEGHYLRVLCDEVFSRNNFINTV